MTSGYSTLFKRDESGNSVTFTDSIKQNASSLKKSAVEQANAAYADFKAECIDIDTKDVTDAAKLVWQNFLRVPTIPSLSKPGWLLRYIVGPHDWAWFESIYSDFFAGITVAFTLIPQALSYATLANVPPINGIYAAILPSVAYVIFGSSMHLGLGPAAIVAILAGELVVDYNINYTANPQAAVDFLGEVALVVGTCFCILSVLNLGDFIHLLSHSVMSGFTTGVSWYIGLSQIKNAFGFANAPQSGQIGYDYNWQVMQWFVNNWYSTYTLKTGNKTSNGKTFQNHYAVSITLGIFFPLFAIQVLRSMFPATPERKKFVLFNIWNIFSSLAPFAATIISAHVAWEIKNSPESEVYYANTLKVVGAVPPGLNFLHAPSSQYDFGGLIGDSLTLGLIAFAESFSVAHRCAVLRNELWFLSASQEMFAIGIANFMAACSNGFPVAGSFSRTTLNAASGSKTAMSKGFTIVIMLITLVSFSQYLTWIPFSGLSAIVWAALYNLQKFSDFWEAWKHSKKDFFVMLVSFVLVFVLNTGVGLAVGICLSLLIVLLETLFSKLHSPIVVSLTNGKVAQDDNAVKNLPTEYSNEQKNNDELNPGVSKIQTIKLRTDVNFVTIRNLLDSFTSLLITRAELHSPPKSKNDEIFNTITEAIDKFLTVPYQKQVQFNTELPSAIVVDFALVRIIDLTALIRLSEIIEAARKKKVKVVLFNLSEDVARSFAKFGLKNDRSSASVNLDKYLSRATNLPLLEELDESSDDGNNNHVPQAELETEVVHLNPPKEQEV